MKIKWVCNGNPDRIPPIGARLPLKGSWLFEVTGYGESGTYENPEIHYDGKPGYEIELEGKLILPKGSPIEEFEDLFKK